MRKRSPSFFLGVGFVVRSGKNVKNIFLILRGMKDFERIWPQLPFTDSQKLAVGSSMNQDLRVVALATHTISPAGCVFSDVLFFRTVGTRRKTTMTWHTPSGDRYLVGEEAEMVRDSLATMVQELVSCRETEEDPWEYGVTLFDELTWQQQLAVLDLLATNLLQETAETLELSGVNEAGVAAVYQNIVQQIELEIELHMVSPVEFRNRWRQSVLEAYRENEDDDVVRQEVLTQDADNASVFDIDVDCLDVDRWRWLTEILADRVLWDRDFEMVNEMIDAPPERAAAMRAALGITPEYYTAIAPDPTDHQLDALFESLEELTRAKPR